MGASRLLGGEYVEPYAGGSAIAIELLFHEYVSCIHINDISRPVYAFWKSILGNTSEFCSLVSKKPLTVAQWDKQKKVLKNPDDHDDVELGFAMFFLNRTTRSGILRPESSADGNKRVFGKSYAGYNAKNWWGA